jgi:hypothetical protein
MLKLDSLPLKTRQVFDYLSKYDAPAMHQATLMGGTALALLISHRLSEDLDFFYFDKELPKQAIKALLTALKKEGFTVINIMETSRLSQARINGIQLDDYIQEYAINGVKVSFGIMAKGSQSRRDYLGSAERIPVGQFNMLALEPLFKSKAVVLMDRVKSRDLFDLMTLLTEHNYTIDDIVDALITIDERDAVEAETALEILVGNIPVDKDDPGFASINLNTSLTDIYQTLAPLVNDYEQRHSQTESASKPS